MRKVCSLIIFGLLTAAGVALAMEYDGTEVDGLSPIMREALRKARQDREIFDKELRQLDRELDRDISCPWDDKKGGVTLPVGVPASAPVPAISQPTKEGRE